VKWDPNRAHQRYRLRGEIVPSVTTVLGVINKPWLVSWANNLGLEGVSSEDYVDRTAQQGTIAHMMIQANSLGMPWETNNISTKDLLIAGRSMTSSWRGGTRTTMSL